jgi:hypothetical protein
MVDEGMRSGMIFRDIIEYWIDRTGIERKVPITSR